MFVNGEFDAGRWHFKCFSPFIDEPSVDSCSGTHSEESAWAEGFYSPYLKSLPSYRMKVLYTSDASTDQLSLSSSALFSLREADGLLTASDLRSEHNLLYAPHHSRHVVPVFKGFTYSGGRQPYIPTNTSTQWSLAGVRRYQVKTHELFRRRTTYKKVSDLLRMSVVSLGKHISRLWNDSFYLSDWIGKFKELKPEVFESDDWALWLKNVTLSRSEIYSILRRSPPNFTEHFQAVSRLLRDMRDLLQKFQTAGRQLSGLCHLALSLIVSGDQGAPVFLTQRRWFLQHSAHPPRRQNPVLWGFGFAGVSFQSSC